MPPHPHPKKTPDDDDGDNVMIVTTNKYNMRTIKTTTNSTVMFNNDKERTKETNKQEHSF
jgi:aspartate 1-decarboxylase